MFSYDSKIISRKLIADQTVELILQRPVDFLFEASQYIWLILPELMYEDPKGARRAFSLTSPTSDPNYLSIVYRQTNSGYKQTLAQLPLQQLVHIEGPFGSAFSLNQDLASGLVMIGGGVGIAPFLGIIRSFPELKYYPRTELISFNSSVGKQIFHQELERLCRQHSISYVTVLGRAKLPELDVALLTKGTFFICGPQGMVDAVYRQLLALGVKDKQMIFEEVYPVIEEVKSL